MPDCCQVLSIQHNIRIWVIKGSSPCGRGSRLASYEAEGCAGIPGRAGFISYKK